MPAESVRIALVAGAIVVAVFAGCSGDDERPPGKPAAGGSGNTAGSGGDSGVSGSSGAAGDPSAAGSAGEGVGGGSGGSAGVPGLAGAAGAAGGGGSDPVLPETCDTAVSLADPAIVEGTTAGMGRQLGSPMCGPAGEATGPEVAYQFTAASTGLLDVKLSAAADLLLSVRGSCADDVSETACTDGTRLIQPIEAGQTVFIVVDGRTETTTGAYTLDVRSRGIECGDGNTDAGEQCDDGDEDSGDGCSSSCEIESSETEPNGTLGEADALEAPFIGQVAGGDVDLVRVVLGAGYSSIVAETRDFGDAACAELRLDSAIAILDGSGAVLAESDDFGGTYCSHAVASALPAGTYYVRVHASPLAEAASFAYVLDVSTDVCGNGVQSEAEECDNGGTDPGCTETCTILD